MREKTNILKGLAIIGVIAIHLNSNLFNFFRDGTFIKTGLLAFDQIIRFSVPLFVFLSGFSLSAKYQNQKFILWDFLKERISKLIPLYLLWSAIIYLVGKADYHLYFVPMIFQLYLLFPLFLLLIKKFPIYFLLTAFCFQLLLLWQFPGQIFPTDQEQYLFSGNWVFYFILGIWLAQKTMSFRQQECHSGECRNLFNRSRVKHGMTLLVIFVTMIWVITDCFNLLKNNENILIATRSSKISVFFYSIFIILGSNILVFDKIKNFFKKFLIYVGRYSYLIYLSHTIIIRLIFEPFYNKNTDPFWLISTFLIFLIGVTFSQMWDKYDPKDPILATLLPNEPDEEQ